MGADVNLVDNYGNTPLIQACIYNNPEIVDLLIKSGADVNKENSKGVTALLLALENRYIDIIKLLLNAHAFIH